MRAIGIDLGTTNSVAAIGGKEVKILTSNANESLTPSVVSFVRKKKVENGEIVVGRAAVNNAVRDPENTIFSIKRLMGRVYGEPKIDEVRQRFNYRLADPPDAKAPDQLVRVLLNDKGYTPVQISGMILKELKRSAELALGEPVTHAVITVPAYFEERQRKATAEAGEAAGLKVIEIIDEPTAAAIAFGIGREDERHRVLVYDLGGGTFDISIIQMTKGNYSVLTIAGNNWLGGDDFDQTIIRRMIDWIRAEYDYDPSNDKAFLAKAKVEAEKAKITLSAQQSVEISVPFMVNVPNLGPVELDMELTREQFFDDIRGMVRESIELVTGAMAKQGLSSDDITEVLLVGGSTAVPLVQEEMYALFGQAKVKRNVNPMECVALGAAILAAGAVLDETGVSERLPEVRVQGVTAMNLGIGAVKGANADAFIPIIPKGTPYPLPQPMKKQFVPTEENQTLIRVPVYEGLNERASLNEQQGVIEFPLPEAVGISTKVEVSFNYDANRILTVGISVLGTDHSIVETLRRDRPRVHLAATDPKSDYREELQQSIRAAEHFLETYGDFMNEEDRQEVREALTEGNNAIRKSDDANARRATLVLRNKIMGSGVASLLFIADRAMHGLPEGQSQVLAQAVGSLRTAYRRRNDAEIARLSTEIRVAIAALMERRSSTMPIEDRKRMDDLLRDLQGGSVA
jgi:molecular chaperone DnaK